MSNIILNKQKQQQTYKEYITDCNQRKHYNLEISKKLNNAIFIEQENDKNYRYYGGSDNLYKYKNQTLSMQKCCTRFFSEEWYAETLEDTKRKTKPFTTCKNKFCAICCKIRSNKLFHQTYDVIKFIQENGIEFIPFHLTLTIKNPVYSQFSDYYKIINDAIHDMLDKQTSTFKLVDFVLGWQCAREVSQDPGAKFREELHPHLHILLLLKPSFMSGRNKKISNADILKEWNYALKIQKPDFPEVLKIAFKEIKKTNTKNNLANVIAEVSKYPTKPGDMLNMPDLVLLDLLKNLDGKRMVTFGGIIKQVRKKLKMANEIEVVDSFIHEELYELQNVKLYNFNDGKYKRQNIRKSDLLEYRVQHSSLLTELNYADNKQKVIDRSPAVKQFLEQDFSEINKIKEIASYKDFENINISDTAIICKQILSLADEDYEQNKQMKYFEKYIKAILISQFIYYSVL